MREQKFFFCKHCGNLVGMIENAGVKLMCCGESMVELIPNTVDASKEKHVPQVLVSNDTVTVNIGSVPHPMISEHYIKWIYLETYSGGQRKCLKPEQEAATTFKLSAGDAAVRVFAYCNLHGLWSSDI